MRITNGGNQPFYVPIAPKPTATLTQYPLATSSTTSIGLTQVFVTSALDLSNLPICLAQTQSTPTVQNCSNMVAQTTLLPLTSLPSGLAVAAQDPPSALPTATLTETTQSLNNSGDIISQNQSPLSAMVRQNQSTPAVHSSTSILPQTQSPVSALMQKTSTPAIYHPGKILPQNQSSLVAAVSQTSSTPAVNSLGKILPQNQSALATADTQTLSAPAIYSPDKILPQNQSSLVAADTQTLSTLAIYSSGKILPQDQSSLVAAVSQTISTPAIYSPGKILPQNQSSLVASVSQTLSTPAIYSPGKILPQHHSPLVTAVSQTLSTPVFYSPGKVLPQNQSPFIAAVSQTPLTPAINNTGYAVAHSQTSLSGTVSQTPSAPSILRSGNTLGQNQLPSSAVVSQSSPSPVDPSFDDMVPQRPLQTPPPIIIVSDNASSQPVQSSLNMPQQNHLPLLPISQSYFTQPFHSGSMSTNSQSSSTIVSQSTQSQVCQSAPPRSVSTYGISGNTSIPLYQNSANMVRQDQSQSFVTPSHQGWFSSTVGALGMSLDQSLFSTSSPLTSSDSARLTGGGNNLTTNEIINESHDHFFGPPTFNRLTESPLNVLANASDIVQREQTTNSNASSLHVQV